MRVVDASRAAPVASVDVRPGLLEVALDRLGVVDGQVERTGDGGGDRVAAVRDRADEVRDAVLVDDDGREAGADRDDRLRPARSRRGVVERPDHRRRRGLDADRHESGLRHDLDERVDEVPVGGGHEHAALRHAVDADDLLERLSRDHGLVEREGDDVERLQPHGRVDLRVGHGGHVELTGDGPKPGDADVHLALGEAALFDAALERRAHGTGVDDRAVDDGAGGRPTCPRLISSGRVPPMAISAIRTALLLISTLMRREAIEVLLATGSPRSRVKNAAVPYQFGIPSRML